MNNLEAISKLALEAVAEGKRKDTRIDILADELEESITKGKLLADNYVKLNGDYYEVESMLSLAKLNNKSLLGELSDMQKGLEAVESTNELLSDRDRLLQDEINRLQKVERENEVLKKDLKKSQEQVKRLKSASPKKSKPVKIGAGVAQLQAQVKRLNKYISELLAYGAASPQFVGGLKHSKQGVMDFVDCKTEQMTVKEDGGEERIKMVQRVVVINKQNSAKILTRVIGEDGIHDTRILKGCTVKIDDEVRGHVAEHFRTLDKVNAEVELKREKL